MAEFDREKMVNLRRGKGWTQEQLGKEIGLSQVSIAMLEVGKHKPRISTLASLAKAFSVEITDLLKGM